MTEKKRWLFFGLPFTFTTYDIGEDILTITEGFLSRRENPCYLYKITDVELKRSLGERIFGLGTVVCYTGDVTHSILQLVHIRNAKEVQIKILKESEEQRIKRRTVNMQHIDGEGVEFEE